MADEQTRANYRIYINIIIVHNTVGDIIKTIVTVVHGDILFSVSVSVPRVSLTETLVEPYSPNPTGASQNSISKSKYRI